MTRNCYVHKYMNYVGNKCNNFQTNYFSLFSLLQIMQEQCSLQNKKSFNSWNTEKGQYWKEAVQQEEQ